MDDADICIMIIRYVESAGVEPATHKSGLNNKRTLVTAYPLHAAYPLHLPYASLTAGSGDDMIIYTQIACGRVAGVEPANVLRFQQLSLSTMVPIRLSPYHRPFVSSIVYQHIQFCFGTGEAESVSEGLHVGHPIMLPQR